MAVTLVTIACSAMLLSVQQAMQASEASREANRSHSLAQDLMNEISACRWADPQDPKHWGPEPGELHLGTRAGFDDLDDYHGWSGPPQTRHGVTFQQLQEKVFPRVRSQAYADYKLSVQVVHVNADGQPTTAASSATLYRQVTVEVTHPQKPPVQLQKIFCDLAPLLGRIDWHDPNLKEPPADVKIVP